VWEFQEATGQMLPFKVQRSPQGLWTIESHSNYPADAKTRMAKAATMVIGLRRERNVSDRTEDHVQFGVVDPSEAKGELKGRGLRVTFKSGDKVLADLIVGKKEEGKTDVRYVRLPDKKRTYAAKIDVELSTKFEDWIERDLLKASDWDLAEVVFDNYKVDEERRGIVHGDKLRLSKDAASKWVLDGLATSEQTNETRVREVTSTLNDLKIVGVRSKPPALTGDLSLRTGSPREEALVRELARRGFFLANDGKLYSNDGDVFVKTKKGVVYTLKFGDVVYGSGEAVSAGKEDGKGEKEGEQKLPANNRYLMITARFDDSLLTKPTKTRLPKEQIDLRKQAKDQIEAIVKAIDAWKPKHDNKPPATLAELTQGDAPPLKELKKDPWGQDYQLALEGETFAVVSYGEDKQPGGEGAAMDVRSDKLAAEEDFKAAESEWKAYDDKVAEGKKEAESLTRRFGPWYYVIDQAAFAKLKPARKDLVQEKAPEKPATPATSGHDGEPVNGVVQPGKNDAPKPDAKGDAPKPDAPKADESKGEGKGKGG
jgi:hypothetical protein